MTQVSCLRPVAAGKCQPCDRGLTRRVETGENTEVSSVGPHSPHLSYRHSADAGDAAVYSGNLDAEGCRLPTFLPLSLLSPFPIARLPAVTCPAFSTAPPALSTDAPCWAHTLSIKPVTKGTLAGRERRGRGPEGRPFVPTSSRCSVSLSKQPQFGGQAPEGFPGVMSLPCSPATRSGHAIRFCRLSERVALFLPGPRGRRTLRWPLSPPFQLLSQAPALGGRGVPSAQCRARFEIMEAIRLLKRPAPF